MLNLKFYKWSLALMMIVATTSASAQLFPKSGDIFGNRTNRPVVRQDGSRQWPDGTIQYPDGTTRYPDGAVRYPDGRMSYHAINATLVTETITTIAIIVIYLQAKPRRCMVATPRIMQKEEVKARVIRTAIAIMITMTGIGTIGM